MAGPPHPTAFDVLAHPTRQRIVRLLYECDANAIAVDALAAGLSSDPNPTDRSLSVSKLEIELHHVHLPKLESVGALEYDHDDGRIVVRDVDAIHRVLAAVTRSDPAVEHCD